MRISLLLMACSVAACTHSPQVPAPSEPVDAFVVAQKFYQPVYPAMDCEMQGRAHKDEIDEHFPAMFFFLDRNHDRIIQRDELLESQVNATVEQRQFLFKQMDTNANGSVDTEEYRSYASSAFDVLDVDGNGDLTENEIDMASFRKVVSK